MHCIQIATEDDLEKMWENKSSYIRLEVVSKHEFSGFSKVFEKDFHNIRKIKEGEFKFGNSFEIV